MGKRLGRQPADPVDLGVVSTVNTVTLYWENASGKDYYLLGATDTLAKWDTIATKFNMPAGARVDSIPGNGKTYRYLRMAGIHRTTQYGFSIWEFQVCGSAAAITAAAPAAKTATATPIFLPADKGALTPALYPNPAKGVAYIVADKTSLYTISDVQGKMLFPGIVQPGTNSINIASLKPGLYFIRLSDRTFKLLIN